MDPGASTPAQSEQQPGIPEAVAAARNLLIAAASLDPAYSMMHELAGSDKDSKAMAAALATIYDSLDSRDSDVRRLMRDALVLLIAADSTDWSRRSYFEQAMAVTFGRVLRSEADQNIFAVLLHSFGKIMTVGGKDRAYFDIELGELLESLTDEQKDTIFDGYCKVTAARPFLHPWGPRKKRSASAKRRPAQSSDASGRPAQCSDACDHAQEEPRPQPTPAFQPPAPAFPLAAPACPVCPRCYCNDVYVMNHWYSQFVMLGLIQPPSAAAGGAHPSGQHSRSSGSRRPGSSHNRW